MTQIDVNGLGTPEKNAVLGGLAAERNVHRGYLYYEDDVTGLKTLLWALNADVQSYGPNAFEVDAALGSTQAKWDSLGRDRMYIGSLTGLAPMSVVHESVHLRNTVLGRHQGHFSHSALNDDESNATGIQHMLISLVHLQTLEGQIRKRASCTSLDKTWSGFWKTVNGTVGTPWYTSNDTDIITVNAVWDISATHGFRCSCAKLAEEYNSMMKSMMTHKDASCCSLNCTFKGFTLHPPFQ